MPKNPILEIPLVEDWRRAKKFSAVRAFAAVQLLQGRTQFKVEGRKTSRGLTVVAFINPETGAVFGYLGK